MISGILIGTLTMEYGGKVSVDCEKTGYRTELEFKLKVGADHVSKFLIMENLMGVSQSTPIIRHRQDLTKVGG